MHFCCCNKWTISFTQMWLSIYTFVLELYGYSLNKGVSSDSSGTFSITTKPNTVKERNVVTPSDNLSLPSGGSMCDTEAKILSK